MVLSGSGGSGGDEPGFEAIRGCAHKRRALNTRLSSGTSAGTFAVSAGPYRNQAEAGTKNESDTFFVPVQKKGWKIHPHVSILRSREFLFQGVGPPLLRVDLNPSKKKFTRFQVQNVKIDFRTLFLIGYKILVWFVFRTCFACAISVRPRGTCESSHRSARR